MKVSILSAVHNEAEHLPEMLESLRRQDLQDWEVLIVSDGSVDSTVAIAEAEAARDSRIRVIGSGEKIGKVAAFNAAFEASRGDVIVLLAGDDTIPDGSLSLRLSKLSEFDPHGVPAVAYFKLRTMSEDPSRDGLVLPRGEAASHSGGSITMTRNLAAQVFPIHPELVSEDLWVSRAAEGLADVVQEHPDVVLNYRIHPGNSNPRDRSFAEMQTAMGARHRAWQLLLDEPRFSLAQDVRARLKVLAELEDLRLRGSVIRLLLHRRAPFADRAAYAAMASPLLFKLRQRFFGVLSGRRSR